jgi:hypothetical protein
MADNVSWTAGSGTTVATDDVSGVHYQKIKLVDGTADGTDGIKGDATYGLDVDITRTPTFPTWAVSTGNTAHVAATRTTLLDLFNASGSGKILKVRGIFIIPTLAGVTGVGQTYEIIRTSAVGTGGSTATPAAYDTASAALPAQVTARTKPTGGATTATTLLYCNGSSEETNSYATLASQLNHVSGILTKGIEPIVLREGYGIKIDQTTNSSVGSVNVVIVFTNE